MHQRVSRLLRARRAEHEMLASAVDKDEICASLHDLKEIFHKSVFALAKELDIRLVELESSL